MSPPARQSVARISEVTGIHICTLYAWRKGCRLEGEVVPASQKDPEGWSAADKFTVVLLEYRLTWAMNWAAPEAFSAIESLRVLPSHTRMSTTLGTPGCAAIHCCKRDSKPSTSSWLSSQRKVESDGDLAMWVPRS